MVNVVGSDEFAAYALTKAENEAAQDIRVNGLDARITDLEARPAPARQPVMVGMYVGQYQVSDPPFEQLWAEVQRDVGPLDVVRCFNSTIPTVGGERWRRLAARRHIYSVKAPVQEFIDGVHAARFKAMCGALPAGTILAVHHESEDDLDGDTFHRLTERAYADLRAVRPDPDDVPFAYISMAHQWGELGGHTADPAPWLKAAKLCDVLFTDVYAPVWDFGPMAADAGYLRWHNEIVAKAGKPWGVTERGISDHDGEDARMDILIADWEHLLAAGGRLLCYYNADWKSGNWKLKGDAERRLFARLVAEGRAR